MQKAGSRSPEVLFQGATTDEAGYVVLYEAISDPESLDQHNIDHILAATEQIAVLHDHNLMQTDIHLNNFVVSGGEVHLVDADGIRGGVLLRHHFKNLACFLAQRAPWLDGKRLDGERFDTDIARVWSKYSEVRGDYVAKMGSVEQLEALTQSERSRRVKRYLEKTQRECSEFVHRSKFNRDFVCDRAHWPRLQRFMVFPEIYLGEGTPLKLGNSATVVRCEIAGESYIVKRYNIKSFSHRVRRWFKRRARNSWRNGHWLDFLGIETAKPVALLEHRFWFFVGVSYVVMPDVGERDLGQVLSSDPGAFDRLGDQVARLLSHLKAAGLQHGDLKATNLIEQESQHGSRIVLIDYDAVRTGDHDKDRDRFLANWPETPELASAWQKKLTEYNL